MIDDGKLKREALTSEMLFKTEVLFEVRYFARNTIL